MANRNNAVSIKVDKRYFDNCFEPERRKTSQQLGINLTQTKFTAYLARSGARIKYPRRSFKLAPKRRKSGGLDFSFH